MFVFVNPLGEKLLTSNTMHGRDFLVVQKPKNKSVVQTVEISSRRNYAISKSNLPCKDGQESNLHECFEEHVQSKDGCLLPWRYDNKSLNARPICNDSNTFRKLHQFLTGANEHRLYKETGCYGPCTYFVSLKFFSIII